VSEVAPTTAATLPVVVLGGSGYVAGELLRLLAGHPVFRVAAITSESRKDTSVKDNFFHLRGTSVEALQLVGDDALARVFESYPFAGVLSALPHGEAAARIDVLLSSASRAGCSVRVVDLSADFRHADPARYAAIYGHPHDAPHRLPEFVCALPELTAGLPAGVRHVAHPGCFTTAATLALAPLVAGGWIEPRASVVAVTGSTGAGRTPTPTTHHPERRSDLFAYAPGGHRHEPEMRALLAAARAAAGGAGADAADGPEPEPEILFVPHSGPFARGIHATITARLAKQATEEDLRQAMTDYFAQKGGGAKTPAADINVPTCLPFPSAETPEAVRSTSSPSLASTESVTPSTFPSMAGPSTLPFPSMEAFPSLSLSLSLSETERSLSFVRVGEAPPRLVSVVGTNRCELALALRGETVVVFSALDNLVKGAAGGALQWMNRLCGLPDGAGLVLPGLGWL
jgi:N-acetyl-gamma-glutamyl-phosphate reductase common form